MKLRPIRTSDINDVLSFAYKVNKDLERQQVDRWIDERYHFYGLFNSNELVGLLCFVPMNSIGDICYLACINNEKSDDILKRLFYVFDMIPRINSIEIHVPEVDLSTQVKLRDSVGMKCIDIVNTTEAPLYRFSKVLRESAVKSPVKKRK
jgi:hypothetical protein